MKIKKELSIVQNFRGVQAEHTTKNAKKKAKIQTSICGFAPRTRAWQVRGGSLESSWSTSRIIWFTDCFGSVSGSRKKNKRRSIPAWPKVKNNKKVKRYDGRGVTSDVL